MSVISIKNKLEVKPDGSISIPGCEPISSLSDPILSRQMSCPNGSLINYKEVLKLIPGSKLVRVTSPLGSVSSGYFIELPSGPPPDGNKCPADCLPDWYKILKGKGQPKPEVEEIQCAGFNFSGCQSEFDPTQHPRDPNLRPNDKPL